MGGVQVANALASLRLTLGRCFVEFLSLSDACTGNLVKMCPPKQSHSHDPVSSATQKWPHLQRFQLKIDVLVTRYFFRQKNCSVYFF